MQTVIEALSQIIGEADFYCTSGSYNGTWDYGAMIEYFFAALVLLVVISSVFRFLMKLLK